MASKAYTNYNLLIGRFPDADGMKTGFICASGFNQVSSATRNGKTVVSVVLGRVFARGAGRSLGPACCTRRLDNHGLGHRHACQS
jgi:D-alanyl-D-alanine carboxypeptidase